MRTPRTLVAAVGFALLATACGSGTPSTEATATLSETPSPTPTATTTDTETTSSTPSASPTPSTLPTSGSGSASATPAADPLNRNALTLDASGHRFTEPPAGTPRPDIGGSCPVAAPPAATTIEACATANAEGGTIAVTVEESGPRFRAILWKSIASGSRWEMVARTPQWTRDGAGPMQIDPVASEHLLAFNVIDVGFEIGGSGGFWEHQIVDWDQGDADPQVAFTIARPSPTVHHLFGVTVVDAPHLAAGDSNCCPTEREVVVVEHPNGRTSVPAVSTIVPRGEDTPELLTAEIYRAWLDGSVGSIASSRIASQPRTYLNNNPSGGQDVHTLAQVTCPWDGTRYECELTSTGNTMTWRIEPTPAGTHQLVEIVEGSP